MRLQATAPKFFALAGLGFIGTVLTVLMGAPFLRVLHKSYKSIWYWAAGTVGVLVFVAAKSAAVAGLIAAVWILVGVYGEMEKRGSGWKKAALVSLIVSTVTILAGFLIGFTAFGITSWDRYVLFISEMLENFQKLYPTLKVDANIAAQQSPSVIISLMVLSLANALIFERVIARFFKITVDKVASELKLLEFRLPDAFIWIFLLGFLFSMVSFGLPWLSAAGLNIVNVGVILFFFQGLAALEVFFVVMKTPIFFRALIYIIMVGYPGVLLSAAGLIDYWVDFRARLRKVQTAESN